MKSFLKRKQREDGKVQETDPTEYENESTEVKLAILSSIHPGLDQEMLLDILLVHDGSVAAASDALRNGKLASRKTSGPVVMGAQTSLRFFAASTSGASSPTKKKPRLLSKKGATLHLFDPEDVAEHTPCTIVHNFLPPKLANELLKELLEESKSFRKISFQLFDNVVTSPHTSALYIDPAADTHFAKGSDNIRKSTPTAESGATTADRVTTDTPSAPPPAAAHAEYLYAGSPLQDIRLLTPALTRARPLVERAVNDAVAERIATRYPGGKKLLHQRTPGSWSANAAFVNCYAGPRENVGWHSDTLTYLGPRAIIGSLSLGAAREFRVRRVVPKEEDGNGEDWDDEIGGDGQQRQKDAKRPARTGGLGGPEDEREAGADSADVSGQIAIHLPHNSLLVMHAEMQEGWKHSVAPATTLDPHPISGTVRINVTYRDYRPSFHPSRTPRCRCGIPCVLRVVQRRRENRGRYFWSCYAGNIAGRQPCRFFLWATFDDEGEPVWGADDKERAGAGRSMTSEARTGSVGPTHSRKSESDASEAVVAHRDDQGTSKEM